MKNIKLISILSLVLIQSTALYSQVAINTDLPMEVLHIDAAKDNSTSTTLSSTQAANDVVFTSEGKIGIGTISPTTKIDVRAKKGNSAIGIGTTTQAAGGALRYNTVSKCIEYSNGTIWSCFSSVVRKIQVLAEKNVTQIIHSRVLTTVTDWNILKDNSLGAFNSSTGIFKAPRTGSYAVTFMYSFDLGNISGGSQVEAQIGYGVPVNTIKYLKPFPSTTTSTSSAYISGVIYLTAGQDITNFIWQTTDSDKYISIGNTTRFSIIEL